MQQAHLYRQLKDSQMFDLPLKVQHTTSVTTTGNIQHFCGLRIIENEANTSGIKADVVKDVTPVSMFDLPLKVLRNSNVTSNGQIQHFCGLQLLPTNPQTTAVSDTTTLHADPVFQSSPTYTEQHLTSDGKIQTYCGLKIIQPPAEKNWDDLSKIFTFKPAMVTLPVSNVQRYCGLSMTQSNHQITIPEEDSPGELTPFLETVGHSGPSVNQHSITSSERSKKDNKVGTLAVSNVQPYRHLPIPQSNNQISIRVASTEEASPALESAQPTGPALNQQRIRSSNRSKKGKKAGTGPSSGTRRTKRCTLPGEDTSVPCSKTRPTQGVRISNNQLSIGEKSPGELNPDPATGLPIGATINQQNIGSSTRSKKGKKAVSGQCTLRGEDTTVPSSNNRPTEGVRISIDQFTIGENSPGEFNPVPETGPPTGPTVNQPNISSSTRSKKGKKAVSGQCTLRGEDTTVPSSNTRPTEGVRISIDQFTIGENSPGEFNPVPETGPPTGPTVNQQNISSSTRSKKGKEAVSGPSCGTRRAKRCIKEGKITSDPSSSSQRTKVVTKVSKKVQVSGKRKQSTQPGKAGSKSKKKRKTRVQRAKKPRKRPAYTSSGVKVKYASLGKPTYVCSNCKALMWFKERSPGKDSTGAYTFSTCCQGGKVLFAAQREPPEPLRSMLDYSNRETFMFRELIRMFNGMFCFTSFGAKIDHSVNQGQGIYTFRVSGQNYHRIGSLLPEQGGDPKYAQLYFHDTENEVRNRIKALMGNGSEYDSAIEEIVSGLIDMFNAHNSIVKTFRTAREWSAPFENPQFEIHLLGNRTAGRQYDTPNASEVAVLVTHDFGENNEPRDVIVSSKNGVLQRISELHQLYMPLQYPILFPYGETGFHEKIEYASNKGKRETKREYVTMREYYSYMLHQREGGCSTLLRGGRLLQQYVVDGYTGIEEGRLRYLRNNQVELRADLYNNICDAITRGDTKAEGVGKRIVLPPTFVGGPRYMIKNYQDAMALCRHFKNPALFVTYTANPKWPEILDMLALTPGQQPGDRPDVVTRVFHMKLQMILHDIMNRHIFGKAIALIYTIEYQKRGLPHAHILIWLDPSAQCKTPSDIDDLICAEIPCMDTDKEAYEAVKKHMMHGPCGKGIKTAPCTVDGNCTKHFPRPNQEETTIDEDGYPVYRRRRNGRYVLKGKKKLDNTYVVPWNRYLLIKYDCHINVEWCNRSRAIKYLFKYLNKGPDRATMVIQENITLEGQGQTERIIRVDEISNFVDCRYLSACEAIWRIFAFDIHYSYPSVMKLSFHLPEQNMVTLRDSDTLAKAVHRPGIKETMFTQWFELNKEDHRARELRYSEVPAKYVWHDDKKKWSERCQRPSVGRIVYCHPAGGERYYLRMLLGIVKGPTCYEDIRTVGTTTYTTFKKACFARGLLHEDKEWSDALEEAKFWAVGRELRLLFVTILVFGDVLNPRKLWDANWETLSEDILYRKRKHFRFARLELSDDQKKNYCMVEIQELLQRCGRSLDEFPDLPKPDSALIDPLDNRLIREELAYNSFHEVAKHSALYSDLNPEQNLIYKQVMEAVGKQKGGFFFVYGPGGTGKTFLYKTLLSRIRSEGKIALAVASSGIAALLLPGGRTAHSRFSIPLELLENSTCGIKQKTLLARLVQEAQLIIWDEAPMMKRHAFEALDRTLRDIMGHKHPDNRDRIFGGIPVLLGGDFRQVLPVIPKATREEIVQSCINRSNLWASCRVFKLTRSMRVNEYTPTGEVDTTKQNFNKWVLDIGDGRVEAKKKEGEFEPTWIKIPDQHIVHYITSPIEKIISTTFPDFLTRQHDDDYLRERAILAPKNDDADEVNSRMFNLLPQPGRIYQSADEIDKASTDSWEQEQLYPTEFLNTLSFPGMPPHILHLKVGLPVMLLRNVNPSEGLCNGTRCVITELGNFVVRVRIITGNKIGNTTTIPRILLTSVQSKWPFVMKRRQFPLRPCYAMTINKSQGQSLNFVGLYLPRPVFTHGQLYVALSRVTSPDGLKIVMVDDSDPELRQHTRNIVYREVFKSVEDCSNGSNQVLQQATATIV